MIKINTRFWRIFLVLIFLSFLFLFNFSIIQKERLLKQDDQIVLALEPVDPAR